MNENPYAAPEAMPANSSIGITSADIPLSPVAQELLIQTKPWIRFISIMSFIGAAFMAIIGLLMIAMGSLSGTMSGVRGPFGSMAGIGGIIGGVFYIILAIIYVMPGVFLSRYASAIQRLQTNRSEEALEEAFSNQKSFWRYIGILIIVTMALVVLAIIAGIIGAVFMAAGRRF
jgi:ABC-type glycerol-3-phosphate transport system permease component